VVDMMVRMLPLTIVCNSEVFLPNFLWHTNTWSFRHWQQAWGSSNRRSCTNPDPQWG
jgi:hypothetical protein